MRRQLWLTIGFAALLFVPFGQPAALATDVSADELTRLIDEAHADPDALDLLSTVTSIDGEPIDMGSILDADPDEQRRRLESLRELAAGESTGLVGSELRAQAEEITSQPPYTGEVASGNAILARIAEFLSRLLSGAAAQGLGLLIIVAVVFAAAFFIMNRRVSRRGSRAADTGDLQAERRIDQRARADAAARSGDYAAAVRLMFVDGANQLEERELVRSAATTSTATVRPLVDDPRFLDRFDAIAYGGADARNADFTEAQSAWDRLLARMRAR